MNTKARIQVLKPLLAVLALAGSLVGCDVQSFDDAAAEFSAGSPPPPAAPPPPPPPPPPGTGFNPVFSEVQARVFDVSCTGAGCHSGAAPPANLNLEAANSFANLVGIAAEQDNGVQRVNPGNPNLSYLIQKLEGSAGTGGVMPPSGMLDQAIIDSVRQWISDGALDDTVVVANPIRVSSIMPGSGASLTAAPTQIVAGFDQDLDVSTVNATTFTLMASTDGVFGNGDDVQITAGAAGIIVPGGNPRSAVFDLNGVALADDTYRITLFGNLANGIMDINANILDGENQAVLPSGNGTEGGDYIAQFTITTPVVIGPTLQQIQAVVFGPLCAGCHTGPESTVLPAGMDLSNEAASLAALVGTPSIQDPLIMRVLAGNPDSSYLIMKIEGAAAVGDVMPPPPSPLLDANTIANIRQWISAGANP